VYNCLHGGEGKKGEWWRWSSFELTVNGLNLALLLDVRDYVPIQNRSSTTTKNIVSDVTAEAKRRNAAGTPA